MIAQNPEALLQLLGVGNMDFDDEEGGELPPGAHVVSVTEEERAAIQRVSGCDHEVIDRCVDVGTLYLAGGTRIPTSGCARSILRL